MVVGYSGWECRSQLDVEVAEGSWLLAPEVQSDLIFQTGVDTMGNGHPSAERNRRCCKGRPAFIDERAEPMGRVVMAVAASSLIATLAACRAQAPSTPPATPPAPAVEKGVSELQQKSARFAPTDLTADISALPANEREALAHMVRAAQVMDALFLEQVWGGNEAMLQTLVKDDSPIGRAQLRAFLINKGPWSRLDHNEVFIPGAPPSRHRQLLSEGATKADIEVDYFAGRRRKGPRHWFLHDDPPRRRGGSCSCPASNTRTSSRLPRSTFAPLPRHRATHAEGVPRLPRRRVWFERLLRQRCEVDGARCHDRADHRTL